MTQAYDPASYADPHGRLLAPGGDEIHRIIYAHHQPVIGRALRSAVVQRLIAEGRFVKTRIVKGEILAPTELAHGRIWPVSYPAEWPAVMLADAGLLILEIARDLLDEGLCLNDGTPRNVLFDGAAPVFVDFTSIVEAPGVPGWRPFDQFAREVMNPLYLASWGRTSDWRYHALLRPRVGISATALRDAMPLRFRLRRPFRAGVLAMMARKETPVSAFPASGKGSSAGRTKALMQLFFNHLAAELRRLRRIVARRASGGWERYYHDDVAAGDTQQKTQVLAGLLQRLAPRRVVDLGTNTGRYAMLASEQGARVIATDIDENCLTRLVDTAQARRLPLTSLVVDAACPTPASGLGGSEFPGAPARFGADLTMALGVVHHLVRHGDYTLERLADAFAAYDSKVLVLEFVGPKDPRAEQLGLGARPAYTLDFARSAVGRHYPKLSTIPVYGDRFLVVGER